jgi:molybdenum-dependent DNA-binding transcriptional regulator ModE
MSARVVLEAVIGQKDELIKDLNNENSRLLEEVSSLRKEIQKLTTKKVDKDVEFSVKKES